MKCAIQQNTRRRERRKQKSNKKRVQLKKKKNNPFPHIHTKKGKKKKCGSVKQFSCALSRE